MMDDAARLELAGIIESLSASDRAFIVGLQEKDVVQLHRELGIWVRNGFREHRFPALWQWSHSQLEEGSPLSFDALSWPVLLEIWKGVRDEAS